MTLENFYGGWKRDREDKRDFLYKIPEKISIPKKASVLAQCPPVYDQGQLGSCTGNSTAGAIHFEFIKQGLTDWQSSWIPSRLMIYFNARVLEGDPSEDNGAEIRDCMKVTANLGVTSELLWPYDITKFANAPSQDAVADASKHLIMSYLRLNTLDEIKACIASGWPCTAGIQVYSNFPMDTTTGKVPMPKPWSSDEGGHAILLVSYDDTKKLIGFRNSWGSGWGLGGYGTLPYKYISDSNLSSDFWTVRAME